jgi:hypothetical protein
VFTHPKGRYDIPPECPFNWGVVSFWLEKFLTVPDQEGMDEYAVMQIIHALLIRHHKIAQVKNTRSMVDYADHIVMNAEEKLRDWVDKN